MDLESVNLTHHGVPNQQEDLLDTSESIFWLYLEGFLRPEKISMGLRILLRGVDKLIFLKILVSFQHLQGWVGSEVWRGYALPLWILKNL